MDIWHDPLFLAAVKKGGAEGTASGDIVTFNAPKAAPLKALTLSIDPVQDLHGYDAPWPAGGGKNKLVPVVPGGSITWNDVTLSVQNGELSLNGKPTTSGGRTSLRTSSFTLPAGTYIISCITTQFVLHDTSDNIIANTLGTASFTLTEDTSVYAGFNVIANTQYSGVLKAQIESGSTATTYAPYSNLCPISGWDEANVWRTGVNVWDEEWEEGTINATTGANQLGPNYWRTKNYIPVKPNTSYVICASESNKATRLRFYDGQKAFIGVSPASGSGYSGTPFTTPSNAYYLRFAPDKNVIPEPNQNVSVNYPSIDHDYHAYTGTTIPVTWSEAGTVYGGVWDVVNGVLRVTHAEVDLGTLDWSPWGDVEGLYGAGISDMKAPTTAEERKTDILCSMYPVAASATMNNNFTDKSCARYQQNVFIRDTGYATAAALTTALDGVSFVYPLATPITIPLTPQEISTLKGQNVVWGDCGPVDVEYLASGGANPDLMKLAVAFMGR